ncbi:transposase [Arthrobacter sp. YAF34]|uniref:IS110 family transposase n=1 Tax=Arthrobacter sp. YAF34 TaxID=3233083 RepID=UPI003F906795
MIDFITSHGTVIAIGVEGTGSYGAELARTLRGEGLTVLEVNRPNRAARRLRGKSDPLDAYHAANSVLEGRTKAISKAKDGPVECLRILRSARVSHQGPGPRPSTRSRRSSFLPRTKSGRNTARWPPQR